MNIMLRKAGLDDMDAINRVIEAAVMTWTLQERVKRLSLPSYRYTDIDFQHLEICLAIDEREVKGVAAWESAEERDVPQHQRGLLLHGLYVQPEQQRRGIGALLLEETQQYAREQGYDGVLVKAQADAEAFFLNQGYVMLPVEDQQRHYARRLWKGVS